MAMNRLEAAREHPKNQKSTRQSAGWYPDSGTGVPIPQAEVNRYHDFGKPFPDVGFGSEHGINHFGRVYSVPK